MLLLEMLRLLLRLLLLLLLRHMLLKMGLMLGFEECHKDVAPQVDLSKDGQGSAQHHTWCKARLP